MSAALIVQHDIAAPAVEVIPLVLVQHVDAALALSKGFTTVSKDNIDRANTVVMRLHALSKDVTNQVDRIKKPLNQLLSAVRECGARAEAPLLEAKASLQGKIGYYNAEVKRAEEAERARVAAEQRKADEAAAAEQRRLVAEAKAKAELQAKQIEELIGEAVEVKPEPVPEVKAAVIVPTVIIPAKPSAVVTRKETRLVIDNPKAVAQAYQIGGEVLVTVNNAAVRRLLDAGVAVPGARLEVVETTAMRGVR